MFCPNCGTQIADDSKFCSGCGAALTTSQPAPAPASMGGAAAAYTTQGAATDAQQPAPAPQPQATAPAASIDASAVVNQVSTATQQALNDHKFKNPFFIGALVASALLVASLFMVWLEMSGVGSTSTLSGLALSNQEGGAYTRLVALAGLVSIGTLVFVRSPKARSICGIVEGLLAAFFSLAATGFLENNVINSSAGQFANNSFVSSIAGTSVELGPASGFSLVAAAVLIALSGKMLYDAIKVAELATA